ncbi:FAD synthase [Candidatus Woesearchaeota archaeon CG10_big_fil_rev_8_21_14_0_10_45_16]|nr:MAG: FAD synthase [Candidatus Woesearchaeota archaeon CG10_big_fil_rev_8_21_14_0_10_45_16]
MTTVMCFGTFDILHLGHLDYFKQAKRYGDKLIIVIARDAGKAEKPTFSEEERRELAQSLKIVDEAVLGYPDDHLKIIKEKRPDILCLGYDHPIKEEELQRKLAKLGLHPKIERMKPYKISSHKSSILKEVILRKT